MSEFIPGQTVVNLHTITNDPNEPHTSTPAIVLGASHLATEFHGQGGEPALSLLMFDPAKANLLGSPDWSHAFNRLTPVLHASHSDVADRKVLRYYTLPENSSALAQCEKLGKFLLDRYPDSIITEGGAGDVAIDIITGLSTAVQTLAEQTSNLRQKLFERDNQIPTLAPPSQPAAAPSENSSSDTPNAPVKSSEANPDSNDSPKSSQGSTSAATPSATSSSKPRKSAKSKGSTPKATAETPSESTAAPEPTTEPVAQ